MSDWKQWEVREIKVGTDKLGEWVDVPQTNFQVMILKDDPLGLFRVRAKQDKPIPAKRGRPPKARPEIRTEAD